MSPTLSCPVCGGTDHRVLYPIRDLPFDFEGEWSFARCSGCEHGMIVPRPSDEELAEFYESLYTPEKLEVMRKANESGFDRGLRQARIKAVLAALGDRPVERLLDVGCGLGHFLTELAEALGPRGPVVTMGIELGPAAADTAEQRLAARLHAQDGDGVLRQLFDEVQLEPASVDVLSMNHFLEHHPQPDTALARAAELVAPGGLIEVEVPRSDGWGCRLLGRWWWPHLPPQHVHLFTRAGLQRALAQAGFSQVLAERTAGYPLTISAALVFLIRQRLGRDSSYRRNPLARVASWVLGLGALPFTVLADVLAGLILDRTRGDILMIVARRDG